MQKLRMIRGPTKRQKVAAKKLLSEGTPSEVLTLEAQALLGHHQTEASGEQPPSTSQPSKQQQYTHPAPQTELELEIEQLSSTGDGLAYSTHKDHVYVVPFSIPGDRVLAKTFPQKPNHLYTYLDFIKVLRPSPKREGIKPGCKYFTVCSGCQLQMMSYEDQLRHKKTIVEKAFKYFSNLDPSRVPPVGDTIGSPLQYGYRTKLTPHYDRPPMPKNKNTTTRENNDADTEAGPSVPPPPPPPVGFGMKGSRRVLDIEQCPIGTPILNRGLTIERRKVHETFRQRKAGATVLLRESTRRKSTTGAELLELATTEKNEETDGVLPSAQNNGDASLTETTTSESDGESVDTSHTNGEVSVGGDEEDNLNSVSRLEAYIDSVSTTNPTTSISPLTLPLPKPLSTKHRTRSGKPRIIYTYDTYQDIKTYTSIGNDWTTEHVGDFTFESRANSFFQNNNSILPTFIRYVREHCMPDQQDANGNVSSISNGGSSNPVGEASSDNVTHTSTSESDNITTSTSTSTSDPSGSSSGMKYLLDAYCGSGLFAVCLSPLFKSVLGIDIDVQGVEAARHNATANAIPNAGFIAADAEYIFADVPFPPDQTLVVIDPPRKGASVDFLRQLCAFGPKRVVYVSCNVHTQARDVGMLVTGFDQRKERSDDTTNKKNGGNDGLGDGDSKRKANANLKPKWRYEIQSLRGFDFFPQTGHVEGVCFLDRVPNN